MAIINKKTFNSEKVFQCDRCHKTKPYSLSEELKGIKRGDARWFYLEDGHCLCSDCVLVIVGNWYNKLESVNFQVQDDTKKFYKKKYKVIA